MSAVPRRSDVPCETSPDLFTAPHELRFVADPNERWFRFSDCLRYSISKADMGEAFGREHGYREVFDAWRRGESGARIPQNLGCFPVRGDWRKAFAEAKARCQAHLEGRYIPPKGEVFRP